MDSYVPLPPLPDRISRLNDLASDLWWSWNAAGREVFRDLDLPLWRFTDHNPVLLLHLVEPERLAHAAGDPEFLRLYDAALAALDRVRAGAGTWWSRRRGREADAAPVAFIAPGFSLHQALPLDGDSAAIAAGDAVKEASDLGLPLVGVGVMYPRAYLHQRLDDDGAPIDSYQHLDWSDAPIAPVHAGDGTRCAFTVPLGGHDTQVEIWQARAGRATVYLLDADVTDASIGAALLEAGAPSALSTLGIQPTATLRGASVLPGGIHVPTWLSRDIALLVEEYVGDDWREHQDEDGWWAAVDRIPDEALWAARQRLRGYLVDFIRERARRRWTKERVQGSRLVGLGTLLDPSTLTIGIAHRFTADYRPEALFQDAERLGAILTAARRPVQVLFAGRARPGDAAGRRQIQQTFGRAVDPRFGGRIAFLEDYDLHAARLLVQGCDLWVTLPSVAPAPLSPGKAAINGVRHLAFEASPDKAAARAFYAALEEDLVPVFYHRDRRGVPIEWVRRVRQAIGESVPRVSARRALKRAMASLAAGADV